ncbi:MAG: histone deacetylase family protein [Gemmatimonadales bacterium]
MSHSVGVVWHPLCQAHDPGAGHPESPARITTILDELRASAQRITWVEAKPATDAELLRVHSSDYLEALRRRSEQGGGYLDADTFMSPHSLAAATRAAGAAVEAVRMTLDGTNTYSAVRPPGHHACRGRATGFCLFNNVVVGVRAALEELELRRVLIVDWDVHHGNGTQELVERDDRIRYVSLHQFPHYPGTGAESETGVGNIFNVPRPPGLPRETYVDDLNEAVTAATDRWTPDLVFISAGFDAMAGDPLGGFTLEPEDYRNMAAEWARQWPVAAILEGGYKPARIARASVAVIEALGA